MSHVLEHFTGVQRAHIFNELYRVLKPGGAAMIITPHWASNRAYGDFTHAWPPVSENLYTYLSKQWREEFAPDNDIAWNPAGYSCDFDSQLRYDLHPAIAAGDENARNTAILFYKEACQDLVALITARK
jgi:SAM-dependent methyltransferase